MHSLENKSLTFSRSRRNPVLEMKEECYHGVYEITYIMSGFRKMFIKDSLYSGKEGDLYLISSGMVHKVTSFSEREDHDKISIYVSENLMKRVAEILGREQVTECFSKIHYWIPEEKRESIMDLFARIKEESENQDEYSERMLPQMIAELLVVLLRQKSAKNGNRKVEKLDEPLEEAAQFLFANFQKEISLEELAAKFKMSPSYFSRKFKSVTGLGFKEYVNHIRLQEARKLLAESELSVAEIAISCGYENSNYFGDVFKKAEGLSPREYRKLRNED